MNIQRLKECRYYRGEEKIKQFPYVPRLFATPEMAYVQGEGTRVEEYALMKLKDVGITQTVANIPIELLAHLFVSHCALANRNKHSLGIISLTPKQMVDSFMNKYIPEYLNIAPSDRGQLIIQVTFNNLSEEDIDYYVSKYRPLDKVGAYGVQEWIGYVGVTRMEVSYFNVMGVPICHVYERLKKYLR